MNLWHKHPGVRSGEQLTLGERSADHMRNGMGSWVFVFSFLLFLLGWVFGNSILHLGGPHGFDKYPFILLNLFLSMLAAIQGAILLIAAKRQDQIASELAKHDYETNQENLKLTKAVGALTLEVRTLTKEIHSNIVDKPSKS